MADTLKARQIEDVWYELAQAYAGQDFDRDKLSVCDQEQLKTIFFQDVRPVLHALSAIYHPDSLRRLFPGRADSRHPRLSGTRPERFPGAILAEDPGVLV
jgi:hypothetical protein